MPGGDGLHYLGRIKINYPTLPVLLFSTYDNPTYVARAVALGASGYVLKHESSEKLIEAIRGALRGELAWTREELRRVTAPWQHRAWSQTLKFHSLSAKAKSYLNWPMV